MCKIKVILLAIILAPLHVMAEQIEVPNEFVDQTPAQASEVNQNFTAVADGVNAQDVRIQNVENAIAGPQEMVFLGYAEGLVVTLNLYAGNQICKDAYNNPTARMVTDVTWVTFINKGQMPLPTKTAGIWNSAPANSFLTWCNVSTSGGVSCPANSSATNPKPTLTACMAPAG